MKLLRDSINSLIILWLIIIQASNVEGTFNATELCGLIANGTKIKDPRYCNTWIECINLQPISHECGSDLFYDRNSGECVSASSINCISSNPCETLTSGTGFVADPYSCNKYYYCSNFKGTQGSCQTNFNYNAAKKTCVAKGNCTLGMDPDSYCNIVPNDVFIKLPNNCTGYQECWENNVINGTCPDTYYFNAFNGVCVQDPPSGCSTNSPKITSSLLIEECDEAGQFISDNKTCNGYYYCKENSTNQYILEHGNCTEQYFFDADDYGMCVNRTQITCEYDRCAGLGFDTIQLSNLSNDNCKGFGICQNGVQIDTGICPNDEYFDEIRQICTTQLITYPACINNTAKIST